MSSLSKECKIPSKMLSLLLVLATLIGSVSAGFTAFAAEDSYQVLADALRADALKGATVSYAHSVSPDARGGADPHATSAAYAGGSTLWDVMDAFWDIAKSIRSKEHGKVAMNGDGNLQSDLTGENNTASKIGRTILETLVDNGYMTLAEILEYNVPQLFGWFEGNFTAEHALLDQPVRGEKTSTEPWTHQMFDSTGYFGVSRTRDEALKTGSRDINAIPSELVLNQRWVWEHKAKYVQEKSSGITYRQYWHELKNMQIEENVNADGLSFDPAQADTTALKRVLKNWRDLFSAKFLSQTLASYDEKELETLKAKIDAAVETAQAQEITNALLNFYNLPTYADVDTFVQMIAQYEELIPYQAHAEYFADTKSEKQLGRLSDEQLLEEMQTARTNYEALVQVSRTDLSAFELLEQEGNLDLQAADEYMGIIAQALTISDADVLVAVIADAIKGNAPYPAMTYNTATQVYTFNAGGLTFEQILELYENVVSADAALTGSTAGQANFPGYNVAQKLLSNHNINVAGAASKAIAAIRSSLNGMTPIYMADYSNAPAGSGWASAGPGYNYEPATAELAALNAAGGTRKADANRPPYERLPSIAAPTPVKIDITLTGAADTPSNYVSAPNFTAFAQGSAAPAAPTVPSPLLPLGTIADEAGFVSGTVDDTEYTVYADYLEAWIAYIDGTANYALTSPLPVFPATILDMQTWLAQAVLDYDTAAATYQAASLAQKQNYATWSYTQAAYGWLDHYMANDYPAVPNTLQPPMNNSARENTEYPDTGTEQQKYDYLIQLQERFRLEVFYVQAQDAALQIPENLYLWLQTKWKAWQAAPTEANRSAFASTLSRYYSLLEAKPDGTYAPQNGVFVPDGVNALIQGYRGVQQQIDIAAIYCAFFNAYRLNLEPEDYARYSNDGIKSELAAVEARLRQFTRDYPGEPVPTDWTDYLETVRKAIRLRVFDQIDSLTGEAKDIAKEYNKNTLLPNAGSPYAYNLNSIKLWALVESLSPYGSMTAAEQAGMALAREVMAYLTGQVYEYETLHWELLAGENEVYGGDWLPQRGLNEPIVLKVGQDEFQVRYEHVENMVNKLDNLLTSTFFAENTEELLAFLAEAEEPAAGGPALVLPPMDGQFLSRLGQMRTSSGNLVIEDPVSGITIQLPPLETKRDTTRVVSDTTGVTAERRWIQAYRADVLLYLLHSLFGALQSGNTIDRNGDGVPDSTQLLSWIISQILPGQGSAAPDFVGGALTQGIGQALGDLDLGAAVRPFFTELLTQAVSENILGDKLPGIILGFYKIIAEQFGSILDGPLLKRPTVPNGSGLLDDMTFASLDRLDLTLGYVLEQIAGKARYTITVSDLFTLPEFQTVFQFGATNPLEMFLGVQVTPKDIIEKCWPDTWPKADGIVPSGAPTYVSDIAQNLADIYEFLSTPSNFNLGHYDKLDAWRNFTTESLAEQFKFGLENIENYAEKRAAFEDVMSFSMSGLAFLLSAVFSDTPLEMHSMNGGANYINTGAPAPQGETDYWYEDLILGLGGVTQGINDLIDDAVGAFNNLTGLIGLPAIEPPHLMLPDVRLSRYYGEQLYNAGSGDVHWRGRYDSRVGIESSLSAVNAYGRIFIPLFEMLGIDPQLIEFSEVQLNQQMAALTANSGSVIYDLNSSNKTAARAVLYDISGTLAKALTEPLLNWMAPINDAMVEQSLGYRPLGKLLDLLPNLAFVTENNIIPTLVNDVLDGLTLDVTLYLGGAAGAPLNGLMTILGDYLQYELFDVNFFLELFISILPDLLNAGPTLEKILDAAGIGMAWLFAVPISEIVSLPSGSFAGTFRNRNDGNGTVESQWPAGNEDYHLTALHSDTPNTPSDGVREGTLGSIVGLFGGDAAANSLSFKLFGEGGLKVGTMLTTGLTQHTQPKTMLGYVKQQTGIDLSGNLNSVLDGVANLLFPTDPDAATPVISDDPAQNEMWMEAIDKLTANGNGVIASIVELFNPQTYPSTDFMNYALLDRAMPLGTIPPEPKPKEKHPFWWYWFNKEAPQEPRWDAEYLLNEVNYSDTWTREEAQDLTTNLEPFLENLWEYMLAEDFVPWLKTQIGDAIGLDLQNFYTAKNLDTLLTWVSQALNALKFEELSEKADSKWAMLLRQIQRFADIDELLSAAGSLVYYANPGQATDPAVRTEAENLRSAVTAVSDGDRNAFTAVLYNTLSSLAPLLKIFLTGGRTTDQNGNLIETVWQGELYPNNGASDANFSALDYADNTTRYTEIAPNGALTQNGDLAEKIDPNDTFYTIGAAGDNPTFLEDYLGFSGYDGYKHALIPIYEHIGVPEDDILDYEQFVERSTAPGSGDAEFFKLLIEPLFGVLDRILEDPINTLVELLPNLIYFFAAEDGNKNMTETGVTNNFSECANRLLRPIYAMFDITAPLATAQEALNLAGIGYPLRFEAGGVQREVMFPMNISLNSIITDLLKNWVSEFSDSFGLRITMELSDLTDLITGTLKVYESKNGQDDAVYLQGCVPDLLTNLFRKLFNLLFTEENYAEFRGYVERKLPDNRRKITLALLDGLANLMKKREGKGCSNADKLLDHLYQHFRKENRRVNWRLKLLDFFNKAFFTVFGWMESIPFLSGFTTWVRNFLETRRLAILNPDNGYQEFGFIRYVNAWFEKILKIFPFLSCWFDDLNQKWFPLFYALGLVPSIKG